MNDRTPEPSLKPSTAQAADRAFMAVMLARLKAGKDLRHAKVMRVRDSIRANDYENSLKLDVAAERVVDEIGPEYSSRDSTGR